MQINSVSNYGLYVNSNKYSVKKDNSNQKINFSGNYIKTPSKAFRAGILSLALAASLLTGCGANKNVSKDKEENFIYYVQEKDTLSSIVRQYIGEDAEWSEVSFYVDEIAEDNGISDPSFLSTFDENGEPLKLDISSLAFEKVKEKLDEKLGVGFSDKLQIVSENINCSPKDLASVIYSESSFDPENVNPKTSAAGLLQFTPDVLSNMGYTTDDVVNMSAINQLDLVEDYFTTRKEANMEDSTSYLDASDLYALVLLPAYVDREVLVSETSENEEDKERYERNKALDIDLNGDISKSDLKDRIALKYKEMLSSFDINSWNKATFDIYRFCMFV